MNKTYNVVHSNEKPKAQPNKTNTKALIKLIAEHSETYLLYEIDDVLRALTEVLQQELSEGRSVKIMNLGVFSPKINASKNVTLPSGEKIVTEGSVGVRFKADIPMNRAVNQDQGE
jgi:nucleoid DNA-binding protein